MATLKYRKNSSSPWETLKALPQTGTVRYDLAQSLDTTRQRMARSNIGAAANTDVTANAVSYDAQSGFTNLQREQACENIGAVTYLKDQILNDTEKAQARKNIGAADAESSAALTVNKREMSFQFADLRDSASVNVTVEANSVYLLMIDLQGLFACEAEYNNNRLFKAQQGASTYCTNFPTAMLATGSMTTLTFNGERSTTSGARTVKADLYFIKIS